MAVSTAVPSTVPTRRKIEQVEKAANGPIVKPPQVCGPSWLAVEGDCKRKDGGMQHSAMAALAFCAPLAVLCGLGYSCAPEASPAPRPLPPCSCGCAWWSAAAASVR